MCWNRINIGPSHATITLQPKTNVSQHQLSPTRTPAKNPKTLETTNTPSQFPPKWTSVNGHNTTATAIRSPIRRREIWKALNKPRPPPRSPPLPGYFAPELIGERHSWASDVQEVLEKPMPNCRQVDQTSAKQRRRELSANEIDSGFASCSRCRKHKQISEFPPKMVSCGVCHGRLYPAREAPSGWA